MYKGEQGLNTPRTASQPASSTPLSHFSWSLDIFVAPRMHGWKRDFFFAREESSLIAPKHGKSRKRSRINLFHCCVSLKRNLDFVSLHWKLKQIVGNLFWKKKVVEFGKEKLFLFNIGREEFLLTRQDLSKF